MTEHKRIDKHVSLIEKAAEIYDFSAALRGHAAREEEIFEEPAMASSATSSAAAQPASLPRREARIHRVVDREALLNRAMIVPDSPVTGLSEEFRIIKRQLLLRAMGTDGDKPLPGGERILICSAHPGEGKTYCAVNLAMSIAAEKDNDVLLVDADFAKPSVQSTLGIGPREGLDVGLMDAIADPAIDVADCVIRTDIAGLSVLPSGKRTESDTEYLASARTAKVLDRLTEHHPGRIVIFDSPPALAASPASELARHVGQAVLVVQADKTTDTALRDAIGILSRCKTIELLLNGVRFSPTGRSFGSYYGYGESA